MIEIAIGENINILRFKSFNQVNILDFSTTRYGGISQGNYESLNLGNFSDDNPQFVSENRKRLCDAINILPTNLFVPKQTHDSSSLIIDNQFLSQPKVEQEALMQGVDALITQEKNIGIAITTADCVPILIFDMEKKVLATIHAGWKGTADNIGSKTISKMIAKFSCNPKNMIAGIAPSISPKKFEVGDEVGVVFKEKGFDLDSISFRNITTGKLHIDLWKANQISLINSGISTHNIEIAEICTYSNPEKFFSARRQTIHSGRMLTGGVILD